MSFRVLIVPDKFKGTLSAREAAGAIANGWWRNRPGDEVEILPMSDGGDGFGEILAALTGAAEQACPTTDAAHRPREARWWWQADLGLAIVEAAQVNGLALLPPGRFHPFELDTAGLGPVLQAVARAGARRCLVGVGGSATNDGGFGLARSLGWEFLDAQDRPLDRWPRLTQLARLVPPEPLAPGCDWVVAVDVDNPLLGPDGCSRVYGPQKGLVVQQAPIAEAALAKMAEAVRTELGRDLAGEPGAGAAGGLGFGLRAFLGARLESGFELFASLARLDDQIARADLVITGEGAIDRQSLMGKGTGRVARRCRQLGKPCLGLAGTVDAAATAQPREPLFMGLHGITPGMTTPAEARQDAARWLERLAAQVSASYDG
ncbi:MAG: glycerate kinase [Verrucomicrobiota bacterium]